MSKNILKDANTLRLTASQKKQIDIALTETLVCINDLIIQAHEDGMGNLQTELPMQFAIDGMPFSKMQSIIWCRVIMALKDKNYIVIINPSDSKCDIYIEWESNEEKDESAKQMKIIAEHTRSYK